MIYIDLILNLALLVALCVISGFIDKRWPRSTRFGALAQGALFGAVAVIGMLSPLDMGSGLIFDGRSVMISLCALFFGPWAASVAVLMTILFRIGLGGAGMIMGVSVILASAAIGLLAHYYMKPDIRPLSIFRLYGLGLIVHAAMVALMFTLPGKMALATIGRLWLPVIILYPLATILAGKILSDQVLAIRYVEDLRRSEEKFKLIFEAANVGKSITLPTGEINVNQAFCDMLGYTRKELRNKRWQDITPAEDIEPTQALLDQLLQGRKDSVRFNKRYIHKNGSHIWGDVSTAIHRDTDRKPLFFITTAIDITEKKKGEDMLLEAGRQWQTTFDTTNDAIWILNQEQRILRSNKTAERFFNRPYGEFIGKCCWEIVHGTAQPIPECPLTRAKKSLSRETMELQIGESWFEITVDPVLDEDGKFNGAIHVIRDITERKRAEEALHEKEIQYHTLADSGSALIWSSGTDKLCNYFNQPWLKFTGRTLEQEMGNGWTEGVHPEDLDRCVQTYITAFDKREMFDMEYRLRHASGEYRWLRDLGTPNYNARREFIGYIGHCFDTTEQKAAEDEIRKLNENLEQRIKDRTAELHKNIALLEEMNRAFVGRELRMMELKERIAELEKKNA